MWPKNATILGISPKAQFPIEQLQAARFVPATDLQLVSSGFSPVRDGELAYKQGKHTLLHFTIEKKHIPASAVAVKLEERCAELEEQQGFAPGKKARKQLKEDVIDSLLPRALATRRTTAIWIDQDQHRVVIDSASNPVIDEIQRALLKLFGDIGLQDVRWPRAAVMTDWLGEAPTDFTNDDSVVLEYGNGKVVKFGKADLGHADVLEHVQAGAAVQAMAMTYGSKVSFVMTDNNQIRRIKPLDILREGAAAEKDVDRFDNDFHLMTRELGCLVDALVQEA